MGDDQTSAPSSAADQWIEDQIKAARLSGRQDEVAAEQHRYRAALGQHRDAIERLLAEKRRIVAVVLPDDSVLLCAKPTGGKAGLEYRRFSDAISNPRESSALAELGYALAFIAYPPLAEATRIVDEWPFAASQVALIANELCGAGAPRLGK